MTVKSVNDRTMGQNVSKLNSELQKDAEALGNPWPRWLSRGVSRVEAACHHGMCLKRAWMAHVQR
jgi:hypothetical protein